MPQPRFLMQPLQAMGQGRYDRARDAMMIGHQPTLMACSCKRQIYRAWLDCPKGERQDRPGRSCRDTAGNEDVREFYLGLSASWASEEFQRHQDSTSAASAGCFDEAPGCLPDRTTGGALPRCSPTGPIWTVAEPGCSLLLPLADRLLSSHPHTGRRETRPIDLCQRR